MGRLPPRLPETGTNALLNGVIFLHAFNDARNHYPDRLTPSGDLQGNRNPGNLRTAPVCSNTEPPVS